MNNDTQETIEMASLLMDDFIFPAMESWEGRLPDNRNSLTQVLLGMLMGRALNEGWTPEQLKAQIDDEVAFRKTRN